MVVACLLHASCIIRASDAVRGECLIRWAAWQELIGLVLQDSDALVCLISVSLLPAFARLCLALSAMQPAASWDDNSV